MATTDAEQTPQTDEEFLQALLQPGQFESDVETDPHVFERISVGIYREPASAIRELISNSYDADATWVRIDTDAPFFRRIVVEDDGNGMSAEAVKRLIRNVGGSAKRFESGFGIGVTGKEPGFSRKLGRRLIGKLGIGLYSVAQLTTTFEITTKEEGSDFERIIAFRLNITEPEGNSDDKKSPVDSPSPLDATNAAPKSSDVGEEVYVAGHATVRVRKVPPKERTRHGTRIELHDIRPDALALLQSRDRWEAFDAETRENRAGLLTFNIGRVQDEALITAPKYPWSDAGKLDSLDRFRAMVAKLRRRELNVSSNPAIDQTLDYFLGMVWKISLSAPLPYLEKNPFELTAQDGIDFYSLDEENEKTPTLVRLTKGQTVGQRLEIEAGTSSPTSFTVFIDQLELRRPVLFRRFEDTDEKRALKRPKMFVGRHKFEDEGRLLSFIGYFFWTYEVRPKELNGVLVRINGTSGTLFDKDFLGFRTSEAQRLRQIVSEAFVEEGLDRALNIDRESFDSNNAQFRALQRWGTASMTKIMNRLKADQRSASREKKDEKEDSMVASIRSVAIDRWRARSDVGARARPPSVALSAKPRVEENADIAIPSVVTERRFMVDRDPVFKSTMEGIALVLESWNILKRLTPRQRSELLSDIAAVLEKSS